MSGSRAWTWRHAILQSDLPPTTRHVLLTVSCFMNDLGGGCYPTQDQLATTTGLSERAVRKHLEHAVEEGWLARKEHGFRGQKWRNHEYAAKWPTPQDVEKGAAPDSARCGEGAERGAGKVRHQIPPTTPSTTIPLNPPDGDEAGAPQDMGGGPEARFTALLNAWPQNRTGNRASARSAFGKLSPADQTRAVEAAPMAVKAYRLRGHRTPAVRAYLVERLFEAFYACPDLDTDGHFRITPDRPEWAGWLRFIERRWGLARAQQTTERGLFLTFTRWPEDI